MATIDIKYLTQPHDGTPGTSWDDFEERILSVAAGKTDDRGWSLADVFNGVDEGSAGGPAVPGGAAGAKANAARRRRLKDSYSLLYTHQLDADIRSELTQNHFQNGEDCLGLPDRGRWASHARDPDAASALRQGVERY